MKNEIMKKFEAFRQGRSLAGTETEKNLLRAFAGESQARNRYTMFSEKAKEQGYEQIGAIFDDTAHNEKLHAQIFFAYLEGNNVDISANYPAGKVGTTLENLKAAAHGEHEEHVDAYPKFAEVAEQENFPKIAQQFRMIAEIEKDHEERFLKLHANIQQGKVFQKDEQVTWVCRQCGHIHVGPKVPATCPNCLHPEAYFEIKNENY